MKYPGEPTRKILNSYFAIKIVKILMHLCLRMWEIKIQHTKPHLDVVFCMVSIAVMEEPTVFVSVGAENCRKLRNNELGSLCFLSNVIGMKK